MESMKLLIYGFMAIIVGLVLIVPIGDQVELVKVASRTISNESVTLSSNTGNLYAYTTRDYTATACRNASMVTETLNIYCNVSTDGVVKTSSTNFSGTAFIDYTYEPNDYVNSAPARSMISLVVFFFALGIVSIGIGLVYKWLKDSGIL